MSLLGRHDRLTTRSRQHSVIFCRLLFSKLVLFFALSITAVPAWADEQRYVYDPLGRLYQVIDAAGNTATYHYDAVGNLLAITRTNTQPAPVITGIAPTSARVGRTIAVTITGNYLLGAILSTTHTSLIITDVIAAPTQIAATFTIAESSSPGEAVITVTTPSGTTSITFTVLPPPGPILPDSLTVRASDTITFPVSLEEPFPVDVIVTLALADPTTAGVLPIELWFVAGQTTTTAQMTGLVIGNTTLSATLGTRTVTAPVAVVPLPELYLLPSELTVFIAAPAEMTVGLAQPALADTTVTLTVADPTIATVNPTTVIILAGRTTTVVTITGLTEGRTTITATSGGLQDQATMTVLLSPLD